MEDKYGEEKMIEILDNGAISTETRNKRMFVLKNEKGEYYSNVSRHHWSDDINSARVRARIESISDDAKLLMRLKKSGDCPHLTGFEKLFVQEVKLVEIAD